VQFTPTSTAGGWEVVKWDALATKHPADLVVSVTYGGEVYGLSEAVAARIAEAAPILAIGIAGDRTLASVIERFHELAAALGADVQDPATDLTAAPTDPSVRVVALSGGTDTDAYVANPAYWPSLRMLADAGVQFTPTSTAGGWEVVKWDDLATKHSADLVLYDQRPNSLGADRLATIPGWSEVPAVRAGNVRAWNPEPPLTYAAAESFVSDLARR
jgi:iron complex transport system substrate-binding protein